MDIERKMVKVLLLNRGKDREAGLKA